MSNYYRTIITLAAALCVAVCFVSLFDLGTVGAQSKRGAAVSQRFSVAPLVTATLTDAFPDLDANGRAAAGEEVTYTATITNNGDTDATGVTFTAPVDTNSTLVAGSVQVESPLSPYAVRCTFQTAPAAGGNSLCVLTSTPYGATGTDNYIILGGQGVRFNIAAANPSYDAGNQIFSFDATIQSLLQQRMGTIDGVTADAAGVRIFVNGVGVTSGTGSVAAFNQTGFQAYTAPNQPYFQFPEAGLIYGEITQPKKLEFSVPSTVNTFTVDFLVSTKVAAKFVINEVYANPGGVIADANGEWFEMVNTGLFPVYLQGFKIGDSAASGDRPLHTIATNPVALPGDYFVFGNTTNLANNGNVTVDYAYGNAIAYGNGGPDATRIVSPVSDSVVYDRVDYPVASVNAGQNGISRELKGLTLDNSNMEDNTNWQFGTNNYGPGGMGTPGSANTATAPPLAAKASSSKLVSAPELGSGFATANLGTIAPGESAVVTYRVTVTDPIASGATQMSSQGTISGNFGDVLTDDTATGNAGDETVTLLGFAPSSAEVSVSGRVTTADGRGLGRVEVRLTAADGTWFSTITSPFGYYQLDGLTVGEAYVIAARHKTHRFQTQVVTIADEITGLDLMAID